MRERSTALSYTPHGYLANPHAVAHSWSEGEGGCLRSSHEYVGFGWQLPWALHARASAELAIVVAAEDGSHRLVTRADYAGTGLASGHHSARLFSYRWRALGRVWEATFTLVARGELGLRLTWQAEADDARGERPSPPAGDVPSPSAGAWPSPPVGDMPSPPASLRDATLGFADIISRARARGSPLGSADFLPGALLGIGLVGTRTRGQRDTEPPPQPTSARLSDAQVSVDLGEPYGPFDLLFDSGSLGPVDGDTFAPLLAAASGARSAASARAAVVLAVRAEADVGTVHALLRHRAAARTVRPGSIPDPAPGESPEHTIGLPRSLGRAGGIPRSGDAPWWGEGGAGGEGTSPAGGEGRPARAQVRPLRDRVERALVDAEREDAAFTGGGPRLGGDWPASWVRGWTYDMETTRMCVFPAGGMFTDVWPSWMVQWPRAVVAEGTLDMARLAYASPDLALRATLSLFRDATAPNVPCVFQHGEPNMVASDGSVCGTSPAWCIPFFNLERLFAFTADRAWLAAIYPYLARYVEWWLAERADADGWAVYKCTWEAGEDDTPRLDPERRGDNVVSAFVRPVELQATMALSAGVLSRFASVLGKNEAADRWLRVEADFLERTRSLWDASEGRFRDWDRRADAFLAPASDEPNYWGVDPCRFSALAFTPVLAGLTDATHVPGLRAELRHYDGPPWTLWASWSYVVLEAAHALGERAYASRVAAEIVGRVYEELDAHEIAGPSHPTPGIAREYWPLDLATWASCEGYGWGANTASLLVRQVFGFFEGPYAVSPEITGAVTFAPTPRHPIPHEHGAPPSASPRHEHGAPPSASPRHEGEAEQVTGSPPLAFRLAPYLPPDFLVAGKAYGLYDLPYRGCRLSIAYRVGAPGAESTGLRVLVRVNTRPTHCRVFDEAGHLVYQSDEPRTDHDFHGANGAAYSVLLTTSHPTPPIPRAGEEVGG